MTDFFAPPPRPVEGGLYIIATPIGNLRDITLRALDVLRAADVVLCEDTRVTGKLLAAYDLKKKLIRYDDHSGPQVIPEILARLHTGEVVAQVSDAGTPLISDPGFRLVNMALGVGARVHPIPGASAVMAALCLAGLPTDRFMFAGFSPNKSAARKTFFADFKTLASTVVFFETGPRLHDSLTDLLATIGDRDAAICRELTKLYETCVRGRLSDLVTREELHEPKGEIVVLIGPAEAVETSEDDLDAAILDALKTLAPSEAAATLAQRFDLPRKVIYKRALDLKK
ncbi:16S rRNA (cytidine(1402)-2'-O)-methyltransferase [Asticcacaulis sp. YBE204]|uniref:16S rRNA (cytidine(1402)-2'-O)-methyltransferase n=1 Tax=Asticcacaulis sp. YBE204 TaxID=1282363 RepID=UPI0003C40E82|nr:16S rRNA (cytidine(1402)-2'-O)-methyltransferase [Asticcacaulis sp. YBE204]ESQ80891.1 16S rRNA methyltransferase [Asticcacaulis sp. YBE204]